MNEPAPSKPPHRSKGLWHRTNLIGAFMALLITAATAIYYVVTRFDAPEATVAERPVTDSPLPAPLTAADSLLAEETEPLDQPVSPASPRAPRALGAGVDPVPASSAPVTSADASATLDTVSTPSAPPANSASTTITIYFPPDAAELTPLQRSRLQAFWSQIDDQPGQLQVTGYTDAIGETDYNADLSDQRAQRVVQVLLAWGMDRRYTVTMAGVGDQEFVRSNDTASDRMWNRRAVIVFNPTD